MFTNLSAPSLWTFHSGPPFAFHPNVRLFTAFAAATLLPAAVVNQHPDVATIVANSVAANDRDWNVAPRYDFMERDRDGNGTKTYQVTMIEGSPYDRLVAINGRPLSSAERAREDQKLERTIAERRRESSSERAERIARYRKERGQDHIMLTQLTKAFDFHFVRTQRLGNRNVYVLKATPRAGYRPPNMEAQALTGMEGTMWVDQETFEWVKVEAHVVRPVSIEGFLAKVEPGTWFEMEKQPVGGGVWLPSHFAMRSRAKVLYVINRRSQDDETYFNYKIHSSDQTTGDN